MSWMETAMPARRWRSWKSRSTASQIAPKPRAEVSTSIRHPVPAAGSTSTSRLPDATTPTSAGANGAGVRPPSNEKCRVSMPVIADLDSPVAEAPRRLVQPSRRAHQVAHGARGQQVARRVARVDAEIGRAPDHAARAQLLHHRAIALLPRRREARHAAYRVLAFLVVAA